MKGVILAAAVGIVSAGLPGSAWASERLTDKQVKAAIESVDGSFDKWKDAIAKRNLDDAKITSPTGIVDVKKFLKDFKDDIEAVKDRFSPRYGANTEATALLRRAGDIERGTERIEIATLPEWKALAEQLSGLASAYGTTFPLPTGEALAMRLTDEELMAQLDQVGQQAKSVSEDALAAMKRAKASEPDRQKVKDALAAVVDTAKTARAMLNKDAVTSEAVVAMARAVHEAALAVEGVTLSRPGQTALEVMQNSAAIVTRAFGAPTT